MSTESDRVPTVVDVLVLGGGPSGATAALETRRRLGCSVLLVESGEYRGFRVGESVPPTLNQLLDRLGAAQLTREAVALPCYGTDSAWGQIDLKPHDYHTALQRNGWHLDRGGFDAGLAAVAADAGVVKRTGMRATNVERSSDGDWLVTLRGRAGVDLSVRAGFLVDATGRRAALARMLGARWHRYDALVAVVARLRSSATIPRRVTIESARDGWWYIAPVPGDQVVVAWLSDADLVRERGLHRSGNWNQALQGTHHVQAILGRAVMETPPRVVAAGSWLLEPAHGPGWIAVGDACMCFDPLSSVGILEAIRSGSVCGEALEAWQLGDHDALRRQVAQRRENFETYLEERNQVYARERRFPDAPFWRRRAAAIDLDPQVSISVPIGAAAMQAAVGCPLSHAERVIVARLCSRPLPAYEVVAELVRIGGWRRAHQRLVLGLQNLLERGLLVSS
jgi:flavin-dependent dehydrogenase